jgi:hypothetical protein
MSAQFIAVPVTRNVVFWAKVNPHFTEELEHNPAHVMLWAGMAATHLIGPYFCNGHVNAASYTEMLEVWLIPQLRDRGLMEDVWLQHDGAPAPFALTVLDIYNEHFSSHWVGCGSPASPVPLSWPPCSPDLTTPDNSLWGIIKGQVAAHRCRNNDELHRAVEQAFTTITPQMLQHMSHRTWWHIRLCFKHDGAHTDPLDAQ